MNRPQFPERQHAPGLRDKIALGDDAAPEQVRPARPELRVLFVRTQAFEVVVEVARAAVLGHRDIVGIGHGQQDRSAVEVPGRAAFDWDVVADRLQRVQVIELAVA